jgi:hypothetical protein
VVTKQPFLKTRTESESPMTNFRDFVLSIAIASVLIAGGWYSRSYTQGSVESGAMSEPILPLPKVKTDDGSNESEAASDDVTSFFADYSRAEKITWRAHYDRPRTESMSPDSMIEVHQVPLVSHDSVSMVLANRVPVPRPFDHLLLVVERAEYAGLQNAKVLGAYRTHMRSPGAISAAIVEAPGTDEVFLVTAMRAKEGYKLRISSMSRASSNFATWENLTANPAIERSDSMTSVASTQIAVPRLTREAARLTTKAVRGKDGLHLDISVRGSSVDNEYVLCGVRYSIDRNKWSSVSQSPPNPPWQLEPAHSRICTVLPLQKDSQSDSATQPRCLALVEQFYGHLPADRPVRAFWVVECSPDCNLKNAVALGVIHPERPRPSPYCEFIALDAALAFHPELNQYFVVVAGNSSDGYKFRAFQFDHKKPLAVQSLELATEANKWPVPMLQIGELLIGHGFRSFSQIESASASAAAGEDAGLVVTMKPWSNWGETRQDIYHYAFRSRQWTTNTLKLDGRAGSQ